MSCLLLSILSLETTATTDYSRLIILLLSLYLLNKLALVIASCPSQSTTFRTSDVHSSTCDMVIRSIKHNHLTLPH